MHEILENFDRAYQCFSKIDNEIGQSNIVPFPLPHFSTKDPYCFVDYYAVALV
jgi:hypothetical protein